MADAAAAPTPPDRRLYVKIRSYPKIVFFYPVWLYSLACALIAEGAGAVPPHWLGLTWMCLFVLNLFVIAFDFSEEKTIIVALGAVVAVLGLVLLGALSDVTAALTSLKPNMDKMFYWMMFGAFGAIFIIVWLGSRLSYWVIEPNEVVYRSGLLRRMKRFSTESLRWDKTVPDVLERIMLGTGTIILTTPQEKHPIVIEHVMRIGKVDREIARILGVKKVVERQAGEDAGQDF